MRILDQAVRHVVRRASWGSDGKLANRARLLFGSPPIWAGVVSSGLRVDRVDEDGVRGEWISPEDPLAGIMFYIHGGGYVACTSQTHRPVTAALARMTRRRVFSIDYRTAPEHRFPAALDDVIAGYRWLLTTDEAAYGEIAVGGDSAGGGLALSLLVTLRDSDIRMPSCAVLASPWTDLSGSGNSIRENDGKCAMFRPPNFREFAGTYLGDASAMDPRASPLFADLSNLPPVFTQVGTSELLLDDAVRMHEKLKFSGVESTLEQWPHVFHGWQMLVGIVPEARSALEECAAFVSTHITRPASVAGARASNICNMQVPQATP